MQTFLFKCLQNSGKGTRVPSVRNYHLSLTSASTSPTPVVLKQEQNHLWVTFWKSKQTKGSKAHHCFCLFDRDWQMKKRPFSWHLYSVGGHLYWTLQILTKGEGCWPVPLETKWCLFDFHSFKNRSDLESNSKRRRGNLKENRPPPILFYSNATYFSSVRS